MAFSPLCRADSRCRRGSRLATAFGLVQRLNLKSYLAVRDILQLVAPGEFFGEQCVSSPTTCSCLGRATPTTAGCGAMHNFSLDGPTDGRSWGAGSPG